MVSHYALGRGGHISLRDVGSLARKRIYLYIAVKNRRSAFKLGCVVFERELGDSGSDVHVLKA
jgi:hypothetical protein